MFLVPIDPQIVDENNSYCFIWDQPFVNFHVQTLIFFQIIMIYSTDVIGLKTTILCSVLQGLRFNSRLSATRVKISVLQGLSRLLYFLHDVEVKRSEAGQGKSLLLSS